ncbi:hypothetical protein NW733_01820 [Mycoplasmopsis felis]|uniref:hypothetical protein n=1 Tax=Mycoplasmopsis felis TaxID=33923 RepID=UPI0021DFF871|nr:hypothetical protein [Mycoplasmopsis felis]MCU9931459.1 hypothetical protein [Mycoplasmopsis felis]
MKIQVSVDGVNFKDVERQDKINFADFGSHNGTALNSSEYTSLDNDTKVWNWLLFILNQVLLNSLNLNEFQEVIQVVI